MKNLDGYTIGQITGKTHFVKINKANVFLSRTFCNATLNRNGIVRSIVEIPEATANDVDCLRCLNKSGIQK